MPVLTHNRTYSVRLLILCGFYFIFAFCNNSKLVAQSYTQSIQGTVIDNITGLPIPGVNVIVTRDTLQYGTITNENGFFQISKLQIGKYNIHASFLGYKTIVLTNKNLLSGRALSLELSLQESPLELEEISVQAYEQKNKPLNSMAMIGARSFTLDETNRYAGAYGDPARMAMNYAGVLPVRDNRNDIIIRGNSAFGLQWRIDGIEIPNPNHFGASGTTGGPITIVNTNLLSKSDFFNGAFPAEYGNAIAGVFDLKTKASNLQKHEQWLQLGWNGLELGGEGPLKKGKQASYLVSARYGLTGLGTLLSIDQKNTIDYKDFTFKLNFPGTKLGSWSLLAIGGNSQIILDESKYDAEERSFETYGETIDNYTSMVTVGVTNRFYPTKSSKVSTTISASGNIVDNTIDTFLVANMEPFLWAKENTRETNYAATTQWITKLSKGGSVSAGIRYNLFVNSFHDEQYIDQDYYEFTDTSQVYNHLLRAWIGTHKVFGSRFQATFGLHGQYYFANGSKMLEPRGGIKFNISQNSDVSIGMGMHSQLQPKVMYYVKSYQSGVPHYSNKNLDFTKSWHNTLCFNLMITDVLRLKIEAYYQYLFDVPVQENQPIYSLVNFGTEYYVERKDSLVNEGTGTNYGIELTLERYLKNNFFFLFTASLFESNYTSSDNITRSTAYNGRYAFNALSGYELEFPKKGVAFIFGLNFTYAGGSPYIPFSSEETLKHGVTMYDWDMAYKVKREDYKRVSFRLGIRRNTKRISMETSIDLQYRSDYTNIYLERIDVTTGEIIDTRNMGLYPMANMRLSF